MSWVRFPSPAPIHGILCRSPRIVGRARHILLIRFWQSFSTLGILLGTLFFAASLTPSLLPRTIVVQGGLSGLSFAVGYAVGVGIDWLWQYLELPRLHGRAWRIPKILAALLCIFTAIGFLWRAAEWQNSIRLLMKMEPVATAGPLEVGLIAAATFAVLFAAGTLFLLVLRAVTAKLHRLMPRRLALVVGIAAAIILFWSVINGVVFRFALHALDASFAKFDALIEAEREEPAAGKTGSSSSLLTWEELGRAGREFIASGPTIDQLQAFLASEAKEPIRVYVGLRSAENVQERARLAFEELKRVGGFDRSMLVIVTPTGTGWVDPAALDSLEYLQRGDVASVAMQYSYLSSPLTLFVDPDYGADSARALFSAIYGYWSALPKDRRPRLYLHGLSLGAMNSEQSTELFEVLGDPYHGALWSGPPYPSRLWRSLTDARNPGSPAWLPTVSDSRFVRFMNQDGTNVPAGTPWGPMRIVYLQYASDAITFFDYHDFYRRPEWLDPRGPDVSPELTWYPIVTALQIALDTALATNAPPGFGHVFAPEHYIDAWLAVTDVHGWSGDDIERLKRHLAPRE
ncbi:MAG: alpha/beta-hydrolase family protein [Rhizobiales bacterium]|nr:alpha/beta-hydrolase family protein [Hyphomicrobiales bacterium]